MEHDVAMDGTETAAPGGREDVRAGLSSEEARRRLSEYGANRLAEPPRPSELRRFAANLVNPFALLLWGGAVLAFAGGLPELTVAIVVVVVVNATFASLQERRAERATEALKRLLPRSARVRRDGVTVEIPAEDLVPATCRCRTGSCSSGSRSRSRSRSR